MTPDSLEKYLEENPHVEFYYNEDNDTFLFRDMNINWYRNDPKNMTQITGDKLKELDDKGLTTALRKGLEIENITRVTGYMSKVASWNKGKQGELKDRSKHSI